MIPPPLGPIDLDSQQRCHTIAEPSSDFPLGVAPQTQPWHPADHRASPSFPTELGHAQRFLLVLAPITSREGNHTSLTAQTAPSQVLSGVSLHRRHRSTLKAAKLRLGPLRFSTTAVLETPTINPRSRSFLDPMPRCPLPHLLGSGDGDCAGLTTVVLENNGQT
ncbi:hypothetical protein M0R45_006593 [Rubus argutus]|uniref:Uncharacterized protein n=1 Tax=Rubus argutus TaxID=59490 RepID=A0AAW1YRC5_RUBAR